MHVELLPEISKADLARETMTLKACPFCGGSASFETNKSHQLMIEHLPDSGVNCPVRYSQVCDTYDTGRTWWNTRKDGNAQS